MWLLPYLEDKDKLIEKYWETGGGAGIESLERGAAVNYEVVVTTKRKSAISEAKSSGARNEWRCRGVETSSSSNESLRWTNTNTRKYNQRTREISEARNRSEIYYAMRV